MKFFETSAVILAAVSSVVAAAHPQRYGRGHPPPHTTTTSSKTTTTTSSSRTGFPTSICLTNATATYLVNSYGSLLTGPKAPTFNSTANSLLASDFTDTSDSINWVAGIPLGGYTFPNKTAFEIGQGSQPPIGFNVTHIMFSCTEVAFRWVASVYLQKFPVKGINQFTATNLNNTAAGWQIQNMYSEFNVGAWEVDINRTCSPQGANIAAAS